MKRLSLTLLAALLLAAWGFTAAQAQPGKGRRGHRGQDFIQALNPTAEQMEKIKALRLDHARQMAQLHANLKIAQLELRSAMDQDSPQMADVKTRVAEVNRMRAQIMEKNVEMRLNLKNLLTPEQKEKLKELRQQRPGPGRMGWRHDGPGPGMGGPHGPGLGW